MLVRDTGIESVTACQTARTLSPNLLSPNLCGGLDAVHGRTSGGCGDATTKREFPSDKVSGLGETPPFVGRQPSILSAPSMGLPPASVTSRPALSEGVKPNLLP